MLEVEKKDMIGNSRSYGQDIYTKKEVFESLCEFVTNASSSLRRQSCVCFRINVFIHTNSFKDSPQYYGTAHRTFMNGTCDQFKLIRAAKEILDEIYRPGFGYKKGGILLSDIRPADESQLDLFSQDADDNLKLNQTIDAINKKFGKHTIKSAGCGLGTKNWTRRADFHSQHYTTDWNQLPHVKTA